MFDSTLGKKTYGGRSSHDHSKHIKKGTLTNRGVGEKPFPPRPARSRRRNARAREHGGQSREKKLAIVTTKKKKRCLKKPGWCFVEKSTQRKKSMGGAARRHFGGGFVIIEDQVCSKTFFCRKGDGVVFFPEKRASVALGKKQSAKKKRGLAVFIFPRGKKKGAPS